MGAQGLFQVILRHRWTLLQLRHHLVSLIPHSCPWKPRGLVPAELFWPTLQLQRQPAFSTTALLHRSMGGVGLGSALCDLDDYCTRCFGWEGGLSSMLMAIHWVQPQLSNFNLWLWATEGPGNHSLKYGVLYIKLLKRRRAFCSVVSDFDSSQMLGL